MPELDGESTKRPCCTRAEAHPSIIVDVASLRPSICAMLARRLMRSAKMPIRLAQASIYFAQRAFCFGPSKLCNCIAIAHAFVTNKSELQGNKFARFMWLKQILL